MAAHTHGAVLWDMDGTLIDSEPVWREAQLRLAAEFDSPWSLADGLAYAGSPIEVTIAAMQRSGVHLPAEQIQTRLIEEVTAALRNCVPWHAGARALVATVSNAGIPQALVTTSPRSMVEVVLDSLPAGVFEVTVCGDDVANRKPHPEPYLTAVRALGVSSDRCVAIEDSPAGLESALAAGLTAVGVPSSTALVSDRRWILFDSLTEISISTLRRLIATAEAGPRF